MTITLNVSGDQEVILQEQAQQAGLSADQYLARIVNGLLEARNHTTATSDPTLALLAQWEVEDATDDPQEIARRQREDEETSKNLQRNRFNLEGRTNFQPFVEVRGNKEAA